jgi:hypothetical protein
MSDITVSVTAQPAITVGVTPAGATGPQGPVGPSAVSADDGNIAVLGSDDLIFVPESGGGGAVESVAGKTGVVVLEKADVGLGNVDNTADADKPVSTATATALAGKSATGHTHAQSDVTGLTVALSGKSDTGHTHTASQVTDFNTAADARVVAGITGKLDTSAAPELIRDTVGTALVAGTNTTITVNDAGDTITISDTVSPIASGSANNPHTTQGAARNSALPKNFWQYAGTEGVDDPTNAILGDEWISA